MVQAAPTKKELNTVKEPVVAKISQEAELAETVFVRDIENRVFQAIILQCLSKIDGITLVEGSIIDNILGRNSLEGVKGIYAEQDSQNHSIAVRVEVNIRYGIPIPEKAEEIQGKISDEITNFTGLHVSTVHVVFKNVILSVEKKESKEKPKKDDPEFLRKQLEEEFANEF